MIGAYDVTFDDVDDVDDEDEESTINDTSTSDTLRHSTSSRPPPANRFYGHDTTLNSVMADLSKKSSTCMIAHNIMRVRRKILKSWWDEHKDDTDAELPAALLGGFFMCDGQPAAQMSQWLSIDNRKYYLGDKYAELPDLFPDDTDDDKDEDFDKWLNEMDSKYGFLGPGSSNNTGSRFSGKFYAFPGGFHAGMKLHNSRGRMFENILSKFIDAWRGSVAKKQWILFPSDPRQLENELPQYILLHYRSAFVYCWESMGNDRNNIPSAADVHRYMIRRAKYSPYRQAVLIELRYAEITKLMRMSAKVRDPSTVEKRGSVKLYMTAIRFALTLWTTTHAVEYVRLATDLLIFMECASPAVKALYANEMFTRLTERGISEHTDLMMEKSVMHIRKFTGKNYYRGLERELEYVCESIPTRPTNESVQRELRTGSRGEASGNRSRTHEVLYDDSPLIIGYDIIHNETQVWHPEYEPTIKFDGDDRIRAEPDSYDLPDDETLNAQVTKCFDIGLQRAILYVLTYHIQSPFRVDRSEKEVPLTKILASTMDRKAEMKKMIDRAISLEDVDLDKAMVADEVREELKKVNELLDTDGPSPTYRSMKKKDMITELIKLRKQHFAKDTAAKSLLETEAKQAFQGKYPEFDKESRITDLYTSKIYCLSANVLNWERYTDKSDIAK